MKHYYYADNDQQFGPFTIEELKSKRLKMAPTYDTFRYCLVIAVQKQLKFTRMLAHIKLAQ